ncbi:MAG: ABC transporter permease [Dysgonamonadaceae bacterium]|jgi:ABC-2 type transport system permease protein|nr:ABC transporter permease [Dysgonamonadaceae bacterium]
MIKYLIQKEFKQIRRNVFVPRLIVALPVMVLLVFPWAANQEITHIRVDMVDHDRSPVSRRLAEKIAASAYFDLEGFPESYENALDDVERASADLVLEIPPRFERDLVTSGTASVRIAVNAVNMMKGGLGFNYMGNILRDFSGELREEWLPAVAAPSPLPVAVIAQNRFNPYLDYKTFMIPALMVMLMTIICGFLPALNIVSEKESGTIEQINVTPVGKFPFILAKLIPYWAIGLLVLTLSLGLAALAYGLTPAGSLLTIYLFALLYIFVFSGFGLFISNYSTNLQQAMFAMFFFLILMILISGLFTPIAAMPPWAQAFTRINPLRYFMEVMRMVYLKGSGLPQLSGQLVALAVFAVVFNTWAILSYRKSS